VLRTKGQGGEISFFLSPPLARSAHRGERQHSGYGGQADLTGTEDKAGSVSTVSLNRGEGMGTEDTG